MKYALAFLCLIIAAAVQAQYQPTDPPGSPPGKWQVEIRDVTPPSKQLMSADALAIYRRLIPKLANDQLEKRLKGPDVLIYTEKEMPRVFQMDGRLVDTRVNVAANPDRTHGNANANYPWKVTAGLGMCGPEVKTFKLLSLPKKPDGSPWPMVTFPDDGYQYFSNEVPGLRQTYPAGTLVAEVLYQHGPDGFDYPFEVRTRSRSLTKWNMDVHRPFPEAMDLMKGIERIKPEWRKDAALADLYWQVAKPLYPWDKISAAEAAKRPQLMTLEDGFGGKVFNETAREDRLPNMPPELVAKLLTTTPFRSALGLPWRAEEDSSPSAPTSDGFNIVPKNYTAGFVHVNNQACMNCHKTTLQHARTFGPNLEWYGAVSGGDGVFSVDRSKLTRIGLAEKFDPKKHPASVYATIPGLR